MERLSYGDPFLLGYSPQRYFANPNSSPRALCRHSDLDFHDVFGGPPRRSSLHEKHYDIGESQESYAIEGREETFHSRNSCSALNEKPVFGGGSPNRGRYPSDEFFDDIFRTDESLSSMPSKHDRDPFSSMPASRIPSPAQPLPPKAEPFGGSPVHAQFSLPAKLAKGMEFSAVSSPYRNKDSVSSVIGSPSSPSVSVCGTLNQAVQGQDDSINDVRLFYRESPLSHEFSISRDMPSEATNSDKQDTGGNLKKASSGSRVSINSNQFHFSIYKWAGQGVPLVMPFRDGNNLRSKERKSDKGLSTNGSYEVHSKESKLPAPVMLGVKLPIFNEKASENNSSSKIEGGNQDNYLPPNAVTQERDNSSHFTERSVPFIYKPEHQSSIQSIITEVSSNLILHDAKENKVCSGVSHAPPDRVNSGVSHAHPDLEKEELISTQEVQKNELESQYSLSYDNNDGQGENDFGRHARMEEMKTFNLSSGNVDSGRNIKRKNRKAIISNPVDATSSTFQTPSINSEDKFVADRVKGKVKDFVKIFDREFPSKAIADIDTRSWSSRWKNKSIAVDETSDHATKEDGKEQIMVNANKTSTDTPIMVGELLKQSEDSHDHIIAGIRTINESLPQNSEAAVGNADRSPSEDLQGNCLIEELMIGRDKLPQSVDREFHNEIQTSDARIRRWSNGKEGNIRSLLSTLQYILWPESGWKPVPLVNIIEGNAVRRAYQKALLCLHPDKLQQKGAAPHQKYIAERVFDILQEAWTHFNSLGSF